MTHYIFMLGWDWYGFDKNMSGHITPNLHFCIQLHLWVTLCIPMQHVKRQCTIFHAHVGPVEIRQKVNWDTLHGTCVFAFGGICGSCSAFRCVHAVKHRCSIFHSRVAPVQIA
jgi:hypothetical protein